jgi:hypothetical protein
LIEVSEEIIASMFMVEEQAKQPRKKTGTKKQTAGR